MKVDMSPAAVTARIKTMDDLWLLTVKLMNSRKLNDMDAELERDTSDEEQAPEETRSGEKVKT